MVFKAQLRDAEEVIKVRSYILLCVPNVFDREGFEEEVGYHLKDIKMQLCTKGKSDTSLLTVPLPDLATTWCQNKQGKGRNKTKQPLLLNNLEGFQQKGCLICTVKAAIDTWPHLGPLWQHFHKTGLIKRALGRHCVIVVMCCGNGTDMDRLVIQRYRGCNVVYDIDITSYTFPPHIVNVHKSMEVQMEDENAACLFKFTNLCQEIMSMTIPGIDPAPN